MAKDMDNRIENVKLMHETMMCMNDEDAYMAWICYMPDCPSAWDIEDLASDVYEYCDLFKTFMGIIRKYGDSGLVEPTREVFDFQMRLGLGLEIFGGVHGDRPIYPR